MQFDIAEDRSLTVQDAAKFLQVTEEAVLSLIHRGELAASRSEQQQLSVAAASLTPTTSAILMSSSSA